MNRSRRRWLIGGAAVAGGAAGIGGAWWQQHSAVAVNSEALEPAFWAQRFERPEGGEFMLSNLRGRPILVNFWATWCPPCVEELPLLDRFVRENSVNGWQVVGLAIDQPSAVRKFLARAPVSFPNGLAGLDGMDWVRRLGNTGGGLPFSLVVDRRGSIVARKMGQLSHADLDAWQREQVHG